MAGVQSPHPLNEHSRRGKCGAAGSGRRMATFAVEIDVVEYLRIRRIGSAILIPYKMPDFWKFFARRRLFLYLFLLRAIIL